MHELADRLERQGDSVHMEMQNWFEVRSSITGSIVIGKPDIIGRDPDGAATVYDVNTGRPRAADEIQVKLYMYLLPVSNHGRRLHAGPGWTDAWCTPTAPRYV